MNELNKIIISSNFTLSQKNLQYMIKDIDQLLECNNLSSMYIKDTNCLEIDLESNLFILKYNFRVYGRPSIRNRRKV